MSRSSYYPFRSAELKKNYLEYYRQTEEELWPVDYEDKTIATVYGPTFVRISGPVDAPPLVLLPGITATSLMWSPNVAAWCEKYRVYAVDTINDYGLSVNTRTLWRGRDYVVWLDNLFTNLGLRSNISLLGMSYGGWLAALYALACPERLKKVVFIAPGGTVLPIQGKFLLTIASIFLLPYSVVEAMLGKWFGGDKTANGGVGDDVSNFVQCLLRGLSNFQRRFIALPTVLSQAQWQQLKVPALFVVGANEKLYPAEKALAHLEKFAPRVKRALIPGVGHDLTFLQADMVNKIVLAFLQEN